MVFKTRKTHVHVNVYLLSKEGSGQNNTLKTVKLEQKFIVYFQNVEVRTKVTHGEIIKSTNRSNKSQRPANGTLRDINERLPRKFLPVK
jgi:hypothetical protein